MKTPIRFLLFTLLCVSLFGAAQGQTEYPIGQSLIPAKTRWVAKIDNPDSDMARGRFELYDISSGSPVLLNKDFPVKGMAYSPIRINENINFARWLSDIFWDNVKPDPFSPDVANGRLTQNYRFNWADGECILPNPESCRGDLTRMNKLNVNTIRVYGMTSRFLPQRDPKNGNYATYIPDAKDQNDPDLVARCTHKQFLDDCAAHGIYVIVGLFLDSKIWDKRVWDLQKTDSNIKNQILWYEKAYKEVVEEVGNHPAVMGFIINNENDGPDIFYENEEKATFFWYQMNHISSTIKGIAPDKLVGVAFHDDNKIVWGAQDHMKHVPNIDFWGVNVYQKNTTGLANIFYIDKEEVPPPPLPPFRLLGYSKLSPEAKKPLLFTEMGWPQTTRTIDSKSCDGKKSITDGDETVTKEVSDIMRLMGGELIVPPDQKANPLCPGMIYFEFSDEWYKEGGKTTNVGCLGKEKQLCTWIGTDAPNTNFPGGWWDEAGFGVFSTKRPSDIPDCAITFDYLPQYNYFGPLQAYDRLELGTRKPENKPRHYLHKAIQDVYGKVPVAPSGASIPTD